MTAIPAFVWTVVALAAAVGLFYLFLTRTAVGRGFKVPLRQMQRPPVTTQYPDEKREPQPRFHGRHQLNYYEDGLEKCIGCELCAWACPADAIYVQGADNTADERYSPGERYASDYQINYNRCIFCALCIEACPTRALTMTHEYELSADTRQGLLYAKEQLLAPLPPGARPAPHTDDEVSERGLNYYGGLAATPPELRGGEFPPAGPRPMRRANDWIGDLTERSASIPPQAAGVPIHDSDQGTTPFGEDTSHLREASGETGSPLLNQDADGRTSRPDPDAGADGPVAPEPERDEAGSSRRDDEEDGR